MRRAGRTDQNHEEVVAALRKMGCSVQSLAGLGNGVPDLLVGSLGLPWPHMVLMEVKDGTKPQSRRRLTPHQLEWRQAWKGEIWTVTSVADVTAQLIWWCGRRTG